MPVIYTDENSQYQLDCSAALWSTNAIHACYQDSAHTYGEIGFLCDVDFVIEDENAVYLVEYKNANVPNAANPQAFNPLSGGKLSNVGKKYFDSLHFLYFIGKDKPKHYIYVLEYPNGNSTSRLLVRNRLTAYLPFALQRNLAMQGRKLIEDVSVMTIAEWNASEIFRKYPFTPIA